MQQRASKRQLEREQRKVHAAMAAPAGAKRDALPKHLRGAYTALNITLLFLAVVGGLSGMIALALHATDARSTAQTERALLRRVLDLEKTLSNTTAKVERLALALADERAFGAGPVGPLVVSAALDPGGEAQIFAGSAAASCVDGAGRRVGFRPALDVANGDVVLRLGADLLLEDDTQNTSTVRRLSLGRLLRHFANLSDAAHARAPTGADAAGDATRDAELGAVCVDWFSGVMAGAATDWESDTRTIDAAPGMTLAAMHALAHARCTSDVVGASCPWRTDWSVPACVPIDDADPDALVCACASDLVSGTIATTYAVLAGTANATARNAWLAAAGSAPSACAIDSDPDGAFAIATATTAYTACTPDPLSVCARGTAAFLTRWRADTRTEGALPALPWPPVTSPRATMDVVAIHAFRTDALALRIDNAACAGDAGYLRDYSDNGGNPQGTVTCNRANAGTFTASIPVQTREQPALHDQYGVAVRLTPDLGEVCLTLPYRNLVRCADRARATLALYDNNIHVAFVDASVPLVGMRVANVTFLA